jgi:hypothetical protein
VADWNSEVIPGVPSFALYLVGAIALAASAGGLWLHGYGRGADVVRAEIDAARTAQVEAAMVKLKAEVERGNELSKKLEETKRTIRRLDSARSSSLDGLVPCGTVPGLYVRLHDDAAAGSVSTADQAAIQSACSPSTVTTAQAASVVTRNYDQCNEQAAQLNALIDWVEGQP